MTDSAKAIFLSYASQDAMAARGIGAALRAAGLEVWFDQNELRGGDAWDEMIRRQIAECALFIPIISANTASRLEGYFRLEWALADQRTQRMARNKPFIVPACIDSTPESGADVPESFVRVQWSRLPGGPAPAAFAEHIAGLLGAERGRTAVAGGMPPRIPAGDPASPLESTPSGGAAQFPHRLNRRVWIGAVAIAALLVAVLLIATRIGLRPAAPPAPQAATVLNASPGVAVTVPNIPEKSIAVLPFIDMSEKKDQEYFSDGLSEELLDLLAQVPDLRVAARTSSFFFKGKAEDVAAIGRKLRVAHVLEGSVRKAGSKIRITAQLIRADNGYHLWSKSYDRDVRDIFMVQDEISSAVVDALKVQLLSARPPMSRHQTDNVEAYSQYLLGNQLRFRDDPQANGQARIAYQKAIALDPRYAAAYSGLSDAELRIADQLTNDPQAYGRALAAAEKAMALAPDAPEGYWARGQLRYSYYFDWSGAQSDFEKAVTLDAAFEPAALQLANLQATLGRLPVAIESLRQVAARDPLASRAWRRLGRLLLDSAQYGEVPDVIAHIHAIGTDPVEFLLKGDLELFQGRPQAALEQFRRHPNPVWRGIGIAMAEHDLGHGAESQKSLDDVIHIGGDALAYQYATVYAWRNDRDEAFRWLDRGFQRHDGGLTALKADRYVANLRGDARYAQLLEKLHLPR
jgi:TolB-like protein/tetratricopeptide (TPR) repeat protein